ncbi:MAG TPA: dihydrodipicolinate synthase family protein [Bryobacteraceae bacterium]|nr:dihydrodipicolinate synthase family protein [Bryobacteraceae bacterium]
MTANALPRGIVSLLETPFLDNGAIDCDSLLALIEATIAAGINGLTGPLVASEVHALTMEEREEVIERSALAIKGRVPYIVGASSDDIAVARHFARLAEQVGAAAYVVAVPNEFYGHEDELLAFLRTVTEASTVPLVRQDLQWNGPGLELGTLRRLRDELPTLAGFKIETVPAGTKYTLVRDAFGPECYIAGGWAVTQLVEALDRGVDAMIPEASLARFYSAIIGAHFRGRREEVVSLFRKLAPVLMFSNQELYLSIAFFKRLLHRRGILKSPCMRPPGFTWDRYNSRVADELIEYYEAIEGEVSRG